MKEEMIIIENLNKGSRCSNLRPRRLANKISRISGRSILGDKGYDIGFTHDTKRFFEGLVTGLNSESFVKDK